MDAKGNQQMRDAERRIRLRGGASTHTGQIRENNEDNFHLWTRDDFVLAVVADGMGGAAAGEEASRLAVEAVEEAMALFDSTETYVDDLSDETVTNHMKSVIYDANEKIVHSALVNPELRGMGTTVTMAFVRGNINNIRVLIAHVGDSRGYLIDGHNRIISQITADHSFVEALVAAGHLTPEQAEEHPMRNVLYRALGQNEDIDIDMYEARLHIDDCVVLCSDGLTRHVKPQEIADLVIENNDPEVAAEKLIQLANSRGGEDNISVIVVTVEGVGGTDETTVQLRTLIINDDDDETQATPALENMLLVDDDPPSRVQPPHTDKRRLTDYEGSDEGGGEGRDPLTPPQ